MKIKELAKKVAITAGLDRAYDGDNVDVMVIPDCKDMIVTNDKCNHIYGSNKTAIIITVRTDGQEDNIKAAILRAIASLATAN